MDAEAQKSVEEDGSFCEMKMCTDPGVRPSCEVQERLFFWNTRKSQTQNSFSFFGSRPKCDVKTSR